MKHLFRMFFLLLLLAGQLTGVKDCLYAKPLLNARWHKLVLANPPSQRIFWAQAYDAKRNILTVFGGSLA